MHVKLKKDALYKPLLRKFRNFFRKLMDSSGLSRGCHHWQKERCRMQIRTFMSWLKLPPPFQDEKSFCSMTIILFPSLKKRGVNEK